MKTSIVPNRQGVAGKIGDSIMLPIMYLLQGNWREVPQRTHRWNNAHLTNHSIADLHADMVEIVYGDHTARKRWFGLIPLFHIPILGGWRKFIVLQPKNHSQEWFVGWVAFDALGITKIPITGPVRLGIGPRQAQFFGLTKTGEQIDIDVVGDGCIGKAGEFAKITML